MKEDELAQLNREPILERAMVSQSNANLLLAHAEYDHIFGTLLKT